MLISGAICLQRIRNKSLFGKLYSSTTSYAATLFFRGRVGILLCRVTTQNKRTSSISTYRLFIRVALLRAFLDGVFFFTGMFHNFPSLRIALLTIDHFDLGECSSSCDNFGCHPAFRVQGSNAQLYELQGHQRLCCLYFGHCTHQTVKAMSQSHGSQDSFSVSLFGLAYSSKPLKLLCVVRRMSVLIVSDAQRCQSDRFLHSDIPRR